MGELNFLLSNYSIGEIFAFLVVIVFLGVAILKAWDYVWGKIKTHFDIQNQKDEHEKDIMTKTDNILEQLENIQSSIDHLQEQGDQRHKRLKNVEKYIEEDNVLEKEIIAHNEKIDEMCNKVTQRLQQDARWSFKDAYNYYYIKLGYIDHQSLEALESKFEHYKAAGGNSFVDTIMEKIRTLPAQEYTGK